MDVDKAIKLAQELRGLILQGFKADKEEEAYEKSDKSYTVYFVVVRLIYDSDGGRLG